MSIRCDRAMESHLSGIKPHWHKGTLWIKYNPDHKLYELWSVGGYYCMVPAEDVTYWLQREYEYPGALEEFLTGKNYTMQRVVLPKPPAYPDDWADQFKKPAAQSLKVSFEDLELDL